MVLSKSAEYSELAPGSPTILVTGATGKIGASVVQLLLAEGVHVKAMVRSRDTRSERLEKLGVTIAVADMNDRSAVKAALAGVNRAFFLPPFDTRMIEGAKVFLAEASAAKLESIVALGQWLASARHPAFMSRQLHELETMVSTQTEMTWTMVIPGFFADNYLRLIGFAAQLGVLPSLTGNSRNAPPSNEDVARVIVAALLKPSAHARRTYRPTGPRLLATKDMAAILSGVLGHRVRSLPMPMWLFLKAARMQGTPASELSGFRHWVQDHREGAFEFGGVTAHVLETTGTPAEDFATIARRYAALPEAKTTPRSRFGAFLNFSIVPFVPSIRLDRYDAKQGHPTPAGSMFAMQNQQWKDSREKVLQGSDGSLGRAKLVGLAT